MTRIKTGAIKNYLEEEKFKFEEEYWPYYNLWAAMIISEIKDGSVQLFKRKRLDYICNMIGIDKEVVLKQLPESLKRKLMEKDYE